LPCQVSPKEKKKRPFKIRFLYHLIYVYNLGLNAVLTSKFYNCATFALQLATDDVVDVNGLSIGLHS
jgi:hypothetical protein